MRKTVVVPVMFGVAGVAVLLGLGKWQVDRLAWKEGVLADIEARIHAAPEALPQVPDPVTDRYLPVEVTGRMGGDALRVLVSRKQVGPGYRVVSALETGGRRVLVDRGFVPVARPVPAPPEGDVRVAGNLHWPDERLGSTPGNDVAGNMWFARDLVDMAAALGTEPVLVVARVVEPPEAGLAPLPVDTSGIPNDHLMYAVTWFSLAAVWAVMSGVFIWRTGRAAKGAGT